VLHGHGGAGAWYAPFSEEEGHCGSVECLARSVPSPRLRLHHAYIKHVVDSINKFYSTDSHIMCSDGKVVFLSYP
jgi:hypothetical protein